MKQILHVFRAGITGGICIALLAACQDGGRGAFKSRRYTMAEICEWQKANNKASSCESAKVDVIETKVAEKNQTKTPAGPPIPPIESLIDPVVTPRNEPSVFQRPQPAPKQPENQDAQQQQDTNPGSAHGQTIVETAKPATASRDQFLAEIEKRISQKDAEATKLFKGIDINVNYDPAQKAALLEIDAYALVGGGMRFLEVKPTIVKFNTSGTINALDYEIREELNGPSFRGNENLTIAATCAVETCEDVRVLMEFKIGTGNLVAAFKVLHVGDGKFEIKGMNLVTRETFKKALESLVKPADVASPSVDQKNSEVAPTETKPVEAKPSDTKSEDTKLEETKPVEAKPEAQSTENKPVEFKPVEPSQVKNQLLRNRVEAARKRASALKASSHNSATRTDKSKVPAARYKDTLDI